MKENSTQDNVYSRLTRATTNVDGLRTLAFTKTIIIAPSTTSLMQPLKIMDTPKTTIMADNIANQAMFTKEARILRPQKQI